MRKILIPIVLVLAVFSGCAALAILLIPLGKAGDELSNRATLSAAVSTTFALISGVIAIIVTSLVSSSDYQAEQAVKGDTARFLASLRSLMMKALLNQMALNPSHLVLLFNCEKEAEVIEEFMCSTTAFAYWSWLGDREKKENDEWHLFFYRVTRLIESYGNVYQLKDAISECVALENLLASLSQRDIRRISGYLSNLAGAVCEFEKSRDKDPIVTSVHKIYTETEQDKSDENTRNIRILQYIKQKGVTDPDIDMFLAVFESDQDLLKKSLASGANPRHWSFLRCHRSIVVW